MNYSYRRTAGYPGPFAPLAKKAQEATVEELKALDAIQQAYETWLALHQQNHQNVWKTLRQAMEKADPGWAYSDWADQNIGHAFGSALEYGLGNAHNLYKSYTSLSTALQDAKRSGEDVLRSLPAVAQWQETDRSPKR